MQINSVNSPAFGCGACAAAYKKADKLAEIPGTILNRLENNSPRFVTGVLIREGERHGLPHGKAASLVNKYLGEELKKLNQKV